MENFLVAQGISWLFFSHAEKVEHLPICYRGKLQVGSA